MPFLPLFIGQLGVTDVGEIAMWTGISLGITPGLTAPAEPRLTHDSSTNALIRRFRRPRP